MPQIESVSAHEVFSAQGFRAIRVIITTERGLSAQATVPLTHTVQAVHSITTEIQAALLGRSTADQARLDNRLLELDGTTHKKRLGVEVLWAVSLALARLEAKVQGLPVYLYIKQLFLSRPLTMPVPYITIIERKTEFIDRYMILPIGATTIPEALKMGRTIFEHIDEDNTSSDIEATFSVLMRACEKAGYQPGIDVVIGIHTKASDFFMLEDNQYRVGTGVLPGVQLGQWYITWHERYPLISIIDPFAPSDDGSLKRFIKNYSDRLQIAHLLKPAQIGTLTEVLKTIHLAQERNEVIMLEGYVDITMATGLNNIVLGIPQHAENIRSYNRLLTLHQLTEAQFSSEVNQLYRNAQNKYTNVYG